MNPAVDLDWLPAERARNDSLATMLFLAALFHGVLILGISFTSDTLPFRSSDSTSLEVVLLDREYQKRPDNADASYLSTRNLTGTGNTDTDEPVRVAYGRDSVERGPGPEQEGLQQAATDFDPATNRYLAVDDPTAAAMRQSQPSEQLPLAGGIAGRSNSVEIVAPPDMETRLRGAEPGHLLISASTRESRIAAYLESWKRRVEQVGTLNFPRSAASAGARQNPVLEVTIAADGSLQAVTVIAGSGNRDLDMAAVSILRLAAPFDPFPDYLRSDYDGLTFSYEWRFNNGAVGRLTVP